MIAVTGRCTASDDAEDRAQALARMVAEYQGALLRMCYLYLQDASAAQDAVQETFLKAYKALGQFRGESSEKTWLFRIGMNVCRDMRRGRWFRYVDRRVTPDTLRIPAGEAEEDYEELAQAIVLLPDKYKEVILLHYYQNMNVRETAQALGLAPSAVSNRLKNAHARLKSLLERRDFHG